MKVNNLVEAVAQKIQRQVIDIAYDGEVNQELTVGGAG